jgi:hypothetical protein
VRVNTELRLPADLVQLIRHLAGEWRGAITQLNQLSEGQVVAVTNAATAAPTGSAVNYNLGDFILNSAPAELGSAGSKYIIHGWRCVAAGAPGTWVQCRYLTGA